MCLFQTPLIHATVAPLLLPDSPTRMSISATMCLSSSCSHPTCYLQDRDEIADEVIIAPSRNHCVNISTSHHSAIWHKPASYRRIHKSAFSGHKSLHSTSFCPLLRLGSRHFALLYAVFQPHVGQFADFQLNATVRVAFIPDSTLEFIPISSGLKCTKLSIFSYFLHSLQWFGPQKFPRYFQA